MRRPMPIGSGWFQGAILTYLFGFTVLGILAWLAYQQQPPIPKNVIAPGGRVVFTGADVLAGMNVFQRHGLMEYGTVYGHGAYLGPDFTTDYLHRSAQWLLARYQAAPVGGQSAADRVAAELHENNYDKTSGNLAWNTERAEAHDVMIKHYTEMFQNPKVHGGLQGKAIGDAESIRQLTAFFGWTAWTASANRPGQVYSYTANWPPEPLAGNHLTPDALVWSVISIIGLLGGTGIVLFLFGRYDWLGWADRKQMVRLRPVNEVVLGPSQKVVVWFLLVSSLLFLLQTFLGGLLAHFRAEPAGFYGIDLSRVIPYNIARTWHLQLAIFWVSASFLATGIFLTPLIAGREPRGQAGLTWFLLAAVALVVFGSLAGEYASVKGWLGGAWFWLGHQGWEYLDLGRLWQILLVVGLLVWVFIVARGLVAALRTNSMGGMPWLLFYAALAIPVFYAVGLLTGRQQGFVINDFWRFWVVHLWVEDFLELFTTVVVAYMFVLLGMVREKVAIRVIYLDIILYSIGGVIGTMHHLYFSGTPSAHLALGATFSAMEVIPLMLLTLEAWGFMRSGERSVTAGEHLHKWAVRFLIAVGVWNFFGAGVFGFLINLPMVSYYEIGTNLTANHGHTAMMGVYGMLAVGLMLFCLRYHVAPEAWSDRAAAWSFWSLNLGLAWMAFANLFPVGIVQLFKALKSSYFEARSLEFIETRWVNLLEWSRLPGDLLFIFGGSLPLLWLCAQALRHPNRPVGPQKSAEPAALFIPEGMKS